MIQFFKKHTKELYSPVVGTSIKLEEVKDKVFAERMMGDGIAFQFEGDCVYAPCDAKIVMIANTNHAIGLQCSNIEILIHVGLDTVELNGKGLTPCVKVGASVKKGDILIKLDRAMLNEEHIDLTTPMIITSPGIQIDIHEPGKVDLNTKVIDIH